VSRQERSDKLDAPEVVEVEDAGDLAGGFEDDEGGDFLFFEQGQSASGEFGGGDGPGAGMEGLAGGQGECRAAFALEQAAEVAVGDDAEQAAVLLDGGEAELFAAHLVDDVGHGGFRRDDGDGVASVHEVANEGEAFAEFAARVEVCEVLGSEALAEADGDGERVAEGEHGGGGGGGGQVHAAGFAFNGAVEGDIGGLGEGAGGVAAEADEGVALALEGGEEAEDFFGFAAGGKRDDDIAGHEDAEVAVDRFGRVEEEGWGAGGAEGGGDFLRDDAGFAHAGDDDAAFFIAAADDELDGLGEWGGHGAVEALGECLKRGSLSADECGWGGLGRVQVLWFHAPLMVTGFTVVSCQ